MLYYYTFYLNELFSKIFKNLFFEPYIYIILNIFYKIYQEKNIEYRI